MTALRLSELAEAAGGTLVRGRPETVVDSFEIDTRRIAARGAFFALKGSRTDGHEFLEEARRRGAAAAVVEHVPEEVPAPDALIRVDDTTAALGRCGAWVRRRLASVRWIAVTGSNGKTTTKEMLADALGATERVHRTPGNFNNHLGVPLTLLACPDDSTAAVVELAMNHAGEIAALAQAVDPDVGLVTNVRAAHLGSFNTLDDIAAAKGELYAVMRDEAIAVVNLDDVHLRVQSARHAGERVTFGQHPDADLRLDELRNQIDPGALLGFRFRDKRYRLQLRIYGAHSAFNALAALAGVVAAGGDLDAAAGRVERLEAGPGRGRVHRLARGMVLIDDSYNSSPAALASVLQTLQLSEPAGRKTLVMGDMLELGRMEDALHREAGKRAAAAGVQLLVGVGPLTRATVEIARRSGVPEVHHFPEVRRAAERIAELVREGDLIMVKGSRAIHLERLVQALVERCGEGG